MSLLFAAFEPILAIARDPTFWSQYFFLSPTDREYDSISNYDKVVAVDGFHDLPEFTVKCCRLTFPVVDGRGLILDFSCSLDYFSLDLLQRDGRCVQIGWDDHAHWHPHVLRWEELEQICKCLSVRNASFAHPGLPLLLLCRWAPITETDDADHTLSLLLQASDQVGLHSPEAGRSIFARLDKRENGFEWKYGPVHGWTLHQDNPLIPKEGFRYKKQLYTLRSPGNNTFPFTEFNTMIQDARENRFDDREKQQA